MNEGLEALKDIREIFTCHDFDFIEKCDIIEKELKEGEMEHTLRVRLENINYELVREKQENEKKLKELEQYKAIKQELGIDLITLIKALKNGAWYIHRTEEKKYYEYEKHPELKLNYDRWCICFDYEHCYPISSYLDKNDGWALTREELK